MEITKDTLISDALSTDNAQAVAMALRGFGMGCFGCPNSVNKTVEQCAAKHGVDLDIMLKTLNEASNS